MHTPRWPGVCQAMRGTMVEPSLTSRLRQRSRRSGMLIGLSMAISILIIIAGFIWIYVRLGPYLSDFIPSGAADATPSPTEVAAVATPAATPAPAEPTPAPPPPTPTWQATHRVSANTDVNFRSGPNTISPPIRTLAPGTLLQFLGEEQQSGNTTWMRCRLEDGTEGWIAATLVAPHEP
ncbi:MAG: SH3 domain-containing protein [Sphaerobacter thermophilus]|uniref:SH3 domain-containing protein n=1 Tax=Sphaerobacter thermophilus TaxID=2057 RepID=UPI00396D79FE